MSVVQDAIRLVYESPVATHIRESDNVFPIIQTFHILGILLMVGSIAIVDLRLLGVVLRAQPAQDIARPLLPITWIGFAVMFASGSLLFGAQAEKVAANVFMQIKLGLLILAGLNVILFHSTTYRSIHAWRDQIQAPPAAKAAAALSLLLWAAVIVTGRFVAYY